MPRSTLVTALLPVKDFDAHFLRCAARSLEQQTTPTWRALVIVEPTRHDAIEAVLRPQLDDPRFRLITNEGRKLSGAFNTGMRHADTE